jgi:hypothetical protein
MEAHNILGNRFQEVVYQRVLSVEMNLWQIEHKREFEMRLSYLARIVCNLKEYSIRNIKFNLGNLENLNKIKVQTSY